MSCSENTLLKGVKDKQKEMNTLLAGGKDNLSAMGTKVAAMKADLASFVPTIPAVPSLQGDLLKLGDITTAGGLASKLAELKASMGSAVPNFDSLISGLGLDSFPPSINSADICSTMPNVETIDGVATVVPSESKIPEEEPTKPEPKEEVKKDLEELNKKVLTIAYRANVIQQVKKAASELDPDVRRKYKTGVKQRYFDLTWPEAFVELSEAGGSTFDDNKYLDYTLADLRKMQSELEAEYSLGWDFKAKGQVLAAAYDTTKQLLPTYADAESFSVAATQSVARRKKKLG